MDWNDPDDLGCIGAYFSRIITAFNPDPFRPRGQEDVLLKDFSLPETRRAWDLETDHCALCNRCQKHGGIRQGIRACIPSQCHRNGSCRFHFPYPVTSEAVAFMDSEPKPPRKRFAAVRNDSWMNQHSTPLLLAWRANVDLQPVLDKKAAIQYVSKYASKPEVLSQSYRDALSDFCGRLPQDLPAEKAVQKLFARMSADRDISAQEAVHLLLGDKLVGCSRTFVNLNAYVDAPHLLKEASNLDDTDCTFESAFYLHYEKRPLEHEHMNAFQFCKTFDVKRSMQIKIFLPFFL